MLVGARYGQREKVFDAVIDKVDVKTLAELSPREIEHDNPEIRRADEIATWLAQLYNRDGLRGRHGHRDPLLADRRDDVLDAPRGRRPAAATCRSLADRPPKSSFGGAARRRTPRTRPGTPTGNARHRRGNARRASPPHCGHDSGQLVLAVLEVARRRGRTRGRTRPSRRASAAAPPGSSSASAFVHARDVLARPATPMPPDAAASG